jgi:flavin-dependent dehydrogenase
MDLKQHLIRQMAWSHATFGPGNRTDGVLDHIRKELAEVEESDGNPDEWVDVVILALDGLTRQLAFSLGDGSRRDPNTTAQMAINLIESKQTKNEGRTWPDWRTSDPKKAIEHDRSVA